MRIAYILSSLANSGPIIVAYDLVQLMIRNGHSVEVFYFDDKTDLDFPCATHRINMKSRFPFSGGFDMIHCHGLRPDIFMLLRKPLGVKRRLSPPYTATCSATTLLSTGNGNLKSRQDLSWHLPSAMIKSSC